MKNLANNTASWVISPFDQLDDVTSYNPPSQDKTSDHNNETDNKIDDNNTN